MLLPPPAVPWQCAKSSLCVVASSISDTWSDPWSLLKGSLPERRGSELSLALKTDVMTLEEKQQPAQ